MVRISAVTGGNDISNIEEEAGRLLDIQKANKIPGSKNLLMKLMSLVSMGRTHIVPQEKQKQIKTHVVIAGFDSQLFGTGPQPQAQNSTSLCQSRAWSFWGNPQ